MDNLKYYDLEGYLFEDIHERFHAEGLIGAFDFFAIVIWKANRAKSKIARKLLRKYPPGGRDLESTCQELTAAVHEAPGHKERLRLLMQDWEFALPMATAILSVFYPDYFTVYDYRVCDSLGKFRELKNLIYSEKLWDGYLKYKAEVISAAPKELSLRDKDRYLYGESAASQLEDDIRREFRGPPKDAIQQPDHEGELHV